MEKSILLIVFIVVVLALYGFQYNHVTETFEVRDPQFEMKLVAENIGRGLQHVTTYKPTGQPYYIIYIKPFGRGIIVLRSDTFEKIDTFGNYPGTCVQVVGDYLYVGGASTVYRYTIDPATGLVTNKNSPELIVRGLMGNRMSDSPIFIVNKDNTKLYVHISSMTNACQPISKDRKNVPGEMPCSRLMNTSGVWLFDPQITNNTIDTGIPVATGIRKMRALALDREGRLYGIIQGRDNLSELYPQYYTSEEGDAYASDELVEIIPNANFGHPYCYWNADVQKFKLAPEYGGDGQDGRQCNSLITKPLAGFNDHMGPNDVLFNTNNAVDWGEEYKNVLFVAWNGRPFPMKCNKTCANLYISYIQFNEAMIPIDHKILVQFDRTDLTKPSGICFTPDNSMLITDSLHGKLYKLSRR